MGAGSRLTIVIPTYDRPGFLDECLASLAQASLSGFRLVVFDNGSTMDYGPVLDAHRGLGFEYVRTAENIGAFGSIPHALRSYRDTEYLLVFHDDDIMHPRMLEWQIAALDSDPGLAFAVSEYREFIDGTQPPRDAWDSIAGPTFDVVDAAGLSRLLMRRVPVGFGSTMYRTSMLAGVEPDLGRYSMYADRPYLLSVLGSGGCAVFRAPLMLYRLHASQDSRSDVLEVRHLVALMRAFEAVLPHPLSDEDRELFLRYSTRFLVENYRMLSAPHMPAPPVYVARCVRAGVMSLGHLDRAQVFEILRAGGWGRLVDAGLRARRFTRRGRGAVPPGPGTRGHS